MKSLVITLEKPVRNVDGLFFCYKEKTELMKSYGIDGIAVIAVPSDILNLSPDGFYEKILIKELNVGHFVCGCDLSFGKDRKGNACWLKEKAKKDKIAVDIIKPLKVSSKSRAWEEGFVVPVEEKNSLADALGGSASPVQIGRAHV